MILGFDTSAAHCAAALLSGDRVLAEAQEDMAKGQAERLMPLVTEVLEAGGATAADLDAIGVGIGPGNFTGIRIAVSAARGLALALGVPAVGVSSLEALALDGPRPMLACLDARREHCYLQRFGTEPRGPELVAPDELEDWRHPNQTIIGPNAAPLSKALGAPIGTAQHRTATAIARIAATRCRAPDLRRPAPLYIRPADAAPSRESGPVILPT